MCVLKCVSVVGVHLISIESLSFSWTSITSLSLSLTQPFINFAVDPLTFARRVHPASTFTLFSFVSTFFDVDPNLECTRNSNNLLPLSFLDRHYNVSSSIDNDPNKRWMHQKISAYLKIRPSISIWWKTLITIRCRRNRSNIEMHKTAAIFFRTLHN